MIFNIITVSFGVLRKVTSAPINYKYDIGQILKIKGLTLPESYVVDFCNEGDSSTISMVGTAEGVQIPDQFLQTGKPVKAYIVLVDEDNSQTRYEITIPVNARPARSDIEPTPEEQSVIDGLVAAMNTAVTESEANADRAESEADRAEEAAESIGDKAERAEAAAQTAETAATNAEDAKDAANLFARNAAEFAEAAHLSEVSAEDSASTATAKAAEASQSAASAAASAASIEGDVAEAQQAAQTATQAATAATQSATAAQGSATAAESSATTASTKASEASSSATASQTAQTGAETAQTAAEAAQQAAEEAAQQAETILVDKAPIITDTASGAIASFSDAADDLPLKSLVASIEPVQDLHGYDSPWPAGGGKNLCPKFSQVSQSGITVTVADDGTLTINGTATATVNMTISGLNIPAGTYTLSLNNPTTVGTSASNSIYAFARNTNNALVMNPIARIANAVGTGTTEYPINAVVIVINSGVSVSNYIMKPQLEVGSTASSFAPFSNICPISGWTEATVQRTGKNLLSNEVNSATYSGVTFTVNSDRSITVSTQDTATGIANLFYSGELHLPSSNYYLSIGKAFATGECYFEIKIYRAATGTSQYMNTNGRSGFAFTLNDGDYIQQLYFSVFSGKSVNGTIYPQIELGSTASEYEEIQGNTIDVNWQDEAGTVYGGILAIDEDGGCVLTVTHDYYNLKRTLASRIFSYDYNGKHGVFFQYAYGVIANRDSGLCNMAHVSTESNYSAPQYMWFGVNSNHAFWIGILDVLNMTLDEFKTWIQSNDVYITRRLDTPITYTLPDVTMLTSLLGTNNIWADTGPVDVEYRADTKLYLEKLTAPTEDDLIADHAITSGSFFMIGNTLYKATAAIANGATITPGTNATRLSLADALNLLS